MTLRLPRAFLVLLLAACDGPTTTTADADSAPVDAPCATWSYDGAPVSWALPAGLPEGALGRAQRAEADCASGLPAIATFDLTGDGKPDLVSLTDCADATIGETSWRVWPGGAEGFGAEVGWALPAGYGAGAFAARSRDTAACVGSAGTPAFFLADLTGDGRADLVVTDSCADASLALGTWRVYPNTGSGFGESTAWALPPGASTGAWVRPENSAACGTWSDAPAWGLLDIAGVGHLDLIVTQNCTDADVGRLVWDRYTNDGTAFAPAPTRWPIPPGLVATGLTRTVDQCGMLMPPYFLLDLRGVGRPDLLAPEDCTYQSGVWSVFGNDGDGFAATATDVVAPWGIDFAITSPARDVGDCTEALPAYALDDIDGDARADLTLTASCTDVAVGDTRWTTWPGSAAGWIDPAPVLLPTGYSSRTFAGNGSDTYACGGTADRPAWTRMDLDGDGIAEIVVTAACDDPTVGEAAWRVYGLTCAGE